MLPLAAGAAVSPTLFGLQLLVLAGRVAPLARAWSVAAGAGAVLLADTGLAFLLARGTEQASSPSEAAAIIKLAIAALLVVLGIRALVRPPREPRRDEVTSAPRLRRSAGIGAVLMAANVTTLALYFPAVHEIRISGLGAVDQATALVLVFTISMAPVLVPPAATALGGAPARRVLDRLGGFLTRHGRAISAVVAFAFAVFLAAESLPELL